ncbi:MAG: exodeoxyribonuclease VII small subunit [Clostridia bacterium]|nr:exodeoxyribonuclease VII small subunit [Clostridia bacterium]
MEKKTRSFESDLARLNEIVEALENGDCPLDQALKLYEEGVSLVRTCSERLEKAELSVKKLKVSPDGEAALVDFSEEEKE